MNKTNLNMTDVIEKKFIIIWKIQNFSRIIGQHKDVKSKKIWLKNLTKSKKSIKVRLRMHEDNFFECLAFVKSETSVDDIEYKIEMLNGKDTIPGIEIECSHTGNKMQKDFYIEKKQFYDILKACNDNITFRCVMIKKDAPHEVHSKRHNVCEALTKIEIKRRFFKTKLNVQDITLHKHPMLPHFDIGLSFDTSIKLNISKTGNKQRHLAGAFLLKCSKGHEIFNLVYDQIFNPDIHHALLEFDKKCDDSELLFLCSVSEEGKFVLKCKYKRVEETGCLESIRTMHLNKMLTDIKVKVGDTEIEAHGVILAARSPVLAATIDKYRSKKDRRHIQVIVVEDWDLITVENFLHFLYTDEMLESYSKNVLKLLVMAHEFKVELLKSKCISFLMSFLEINDEDSFTREIISAAIKVCSKELETKAKCRLRDDCFGIDTMKYHILLKY